MKLNEITTHPAVEAWLEARIRWIRASGVPAKHQRTEVEIARDLAFDQHERLAQRQKAAR